MEFEVVGSSLRPLKPLIGKTALLLLAFAVVGVLLVPCALALAPHPFNVGTNLLYKGELLKAEQQFVKAIKMNRRDTDALNNLAVTRIRLERYKEGLALLRRVLAVNRRYAGANLNIGSAYILMKDADKAVTPTIRATGASSGRLAAQVRSSAYCNLGHIYALTKRFDKAKSAYERSLAISRSVHASVGLAAVQASAGEFDQAISSLEGLRAEGLPGSLDKVVKDNLAMAYYARGLDSLGGRELDNASQDFAKSERIETSDYALLGKALVLAEKGESEKAAKALDSLQKSARSQEVRKAAAEDLKRLKAKSSSKGCLGIGVLLLGSCLVAVHRLSGPC